MDLASSRPVTDAHSGPVSRVRIDVARRKSRISGDLVLEHLVGEVVEDEPVVAGELGDERRRVVTALHRQRGELERSDPTLGPGLQHVDVGGREREVHGVGQVGGGFVGGEAEICSSDLEQVAVGPERSEWERRVGAGGDHEADLGWQVLEQERDRIVDLGGFDHVVVVEHEDQIDCSGLEVVDQGGDDRLRRGGRRSAAWCPPRC